MIVVIYSYGLNLVEYYFLNVVIYVIRMEEYFNEKVEIWDIREIIYIVVDFFYILIMN